MFASIATAAAQPSATPPIPPEATAARTTSRALESEDTLSALTESLATLLRRPVAIALFSGRLVAGCDPLSEGAARQSPSFWRAGLRLLKARYGEDSIPKQGRTLRMSSDDGAPGHASQLVCPVRAGDSAAAALFVSEGAARLSALCVHHIEHTALAAGLFLEQRQKRLDLERGVGAMLLHELLTGRFRSDLLQRSLAASIHLSMDQDYRVVMLNAHDERAASNSQAATRLVEQLLTLLAERDSPRAVCSMQAGAAFLLPAQVDVARFWAALAHPTMSLVVGPPVRGAEAIAASFTDVQSLSASAEAGLFHTQGRLALPSVLRGDRAAQQAFVESIFGKLSKLRGGKSLVRSLATFARLGFHQARAARALYVHPNTLRYRIDRISQTLGLDLLDADVRFRVQLASHLWALEVERATAAQTDAAKRP